MGIGRWIGCLRAFPAVVAHRVVRRMQAALMILGIFSALAAFGFLIAGFVSMVEFDRQDRSKVDLVVTGGIFSALKDIGENWEFRPEQRRLVYVGLVCSLVSAACLVLSQIDREDAPSNPAAGNAGIASPVDNWTALARRA